MRRPTIGSVDPLLQKHPHGIAGLFPNYLADAGFDRQLMRAVSHGHETVSHALP
jgi:hypothetical protein